MKVKQLQAKGGQGYKQRFDPQTIFLMQNMAEDLGMAIQVKPSQAVLIRRAIRYYAEFIQELVHVRNPSIVKLRAEKNELLIAAGRGRAASLVTEEVQAEHE